MLRTYNDVSADQLVASSSAASEETSVKQRLIDEGMGKINEVGDTKAANMAGNNVPTTVAPSTETPEEKVEGEVTEDRENSTYFSTWGSVAPRSTPGKSVYFSEPYTSRHFLTARATPDLVDAMLSLPVPAVLSSLTKHMPTHFLIFILTFFPASRIRQVILTNLPTNADNALVASLVHGGAIEIYRLTKFANGSTAHVLFTTGDAADAYYDKYPNGVKFHSQGRKYVAFVDKVAQVDVMSGIMRGYLESGASRVVRAIGVDEDWSMLALRTLAEKKGRKLEAIHDTCRDEVSCTIVLVATQQANMSRSGPLSTVSLASKMLCTSKVNWSAMTISKAASFNSSKTPARRRRKFTWTRDS